MAAFINSSPSLSGATAPYYMTGPSYLAAFKLLKAYVESKGDTIKTVEV